MAWILPGVTVFFSLVFPFLDSHGVMGFSFLVELDFRMDLMLCEVDL